VNVLKLFFGWPGGGTWSNVVAAVECTAFGAAGAWLFRDRLGRKLAAWWHKHHAEHTRDDLAGLAEHLRTHINRQLEDHHEKIIKAIEEKR
jgi:hypothetical protein